MPGERRLVAGFNEGGRWEKLYDQPACPHLGGAIKPPLAYFHKCIDITSL